MLVYWKKRKKMRREKNSNQMSGSDNVLSHAYGDGKQENLTTAAAMAAAHHHQEHKNGHININVWKSFRSNWRIRINKILIKLDQISHTQLMKKKWSLWATSFIIQRLDHCLLFLSPAMSAPNRTHTTAPANWQTNNVNKTKWNYTI